MGRLVLLPGGRYRCGMDAVWLWMLRYLFSGQLGSSLRVHDPENAARRLGARGWPTAYESLYCPTTYSDLWRAEQQEKQERRYPCKYSDPP